MKEFIKKIKRVYSYYKRHGIWRLIRDRGLDRITRFFWRYKYKCTPKRLLINKAKVPIKKPVFILGVEGGGLTLLSKMLHRHPDVVYPEGNNNHWMGRDEMDKIPIFGLPDELALRSPGFRAWRSYLPSDGAHHIFGTERARVYATDMLVDEYRKTENDASPELEKSFRDVIKRIIIAYAHDPYNARFVDKPQTYTIKIPLISELLKGINVKFVLVVRNPYALGWSYVMKDEGYRYRLYSKKLTNEEKVRFGAQHWKNSYHIALDDLERRGDYHVLRFEDLLRDPETEAKKVFDYCELTFNEDYLPQPSHKLPLGSADRSKWYPIRTNVNDKYLDNIPSWAIEIVEEECQELIDKFNYTPKGS